MFHLYSISVINAAAPTEKHSLQKLDYIATKGNKKTTFKAAGAKQNPKSNPFDFLNLTHVAEVCSIFAIELVQGQFVIILQGQEDKVSSDRRAHVWILHASSGSL